MCGLEGFVCIKRLALPKHMKFLKNVASILDATSEFEPADAVFNFANRVATSERER